MEEADPSPHGQDMRELVERLIGAEGLGVWDDGGPVPVAARSRPTPTGASINLVYTPPKNRGRGYATACVAALSRRLLDFGKTFCTLFTNLANPTSNKIYRRVGYRLIADFVEIRFREGLPK
jgi:predicted GNAT family acetyltransferase